MGINPITSGNITASHAGARCGCRIVRPLAHAGEEGSMAIVAAFAVPHPPLIIPAVGRGREKEIQDTIDAYRQVGARIAEVDPQTIVISSPHSVMYRD